jgi:hypothetical protein
MPDAYFLPTVDPSKKFVTILLPVGIKVIKEKIKQFRSPHKVISIYIQPESEEFLAKCYKQKTGLEYISEKYNVENEVIIRGRHLCDYILLNREGELNTLIKEILALVENL